MPAHPRETIERIGHAAILEAASTILTSVMARSSTDWDWTKRYRESVEHAVGLAAMIDTIANEEIAAPTENEAIIKAPVGLRAQGKKPA